MAYQEYTENFFLSDVLEAFGWDLLLAEVEIHEGVLILSRGDSLLIFDDLHNYLNYEKTEQLHKFVAPLIN